MRRSIVAAAFAALLLVAIPSTSSAQVVVGSYGTPVYSYSYAYPTYTYSYVPVYNYPTYSYPVYSYPAYGYYPSYGGLSVGFGYYGGWGRNYGGWGRHYGGWGGHYGGFHGGWGGHHHR